MTNKKTINPKDLENTFFIEHSSKRNYTCLRFIDSYIPDAITDFSYPPSWHWYNIYYFEEKMFQRMYIKEDDIEKLLKNKRLYMKQSKITVEVL